MSRKSSRKKRGEKREIKLEISPLESLWPFPAGIFLITILLAVPASVMMEPSTLLFVASLSLSVGCASSASIVSGRGRGTNGVLAGFVLGFGMKLGSFLFIYLTYKDKGIPLKWPLAFVLTAYFAYYMWTSYRFHVLSTAKKK